MNPTLAIALSSAVGYILIFGFMGYLVFRIQRVQKESEAAIREDAKREALVDAKAEAMRIKEESEAQVREDRKELQRLAEKLEAKELQIDHQRELLNERENLLANEIRESNELRRELDVKYNSIQLELAKIATLDRDQARNLYLSRIESEFRDIGRRKAEEIQREAVEQASEKGKKAVLDAMQRSLTEYVTEATVALIELPSEDMKGRLIGREGRNIRSFEQVAGVDLIIDETPESVMISCFDPVRRETARLALMNLMTDGRIHPVRIEELYEKAKEEVQRMIQEAGHRAAAEAKVVGLTPMALDTLGRLRFRASYGQNVLDHSVEVSRMCRILANELGFNADIASRAGLLHDIGKALGPEWEGPHAISGMDFLKVQGEKDSILLAVGAHHYDIDPSTPEAQIVIIADTLSASRPGARRESLDNYVKRLASLEQIALSFPGVDRTYAVQSGREVRLIVKPEVIDDLGAAKLANEVARRIENEMVYPGQIKITVIRETRSQDIAK